MLDTGNAPPAEGGRHHDHGDGLDVGSQGWGTSAHGTSNSDTLILILLVPLYVNLDYSVSESGYAVTRTTKYESLVSTLFRIAFAGNYRHLGNIAPRVARKQPDRQG